MRKLYASSSSLSASYFVNTTDKGYLSRRRTYHRSSCLADGIDFVENDDVQSGMRTEALLLFLGVGKELADIGLRLANILVQDGGSIDNLGFASVQHFADLPRHQGLAGAGWAVQQNATHVLHTYNQPIRFKLTLLSLIRLGEY